MTPSERWLSAAWPFVRSRLPAPPARIVDVGCGPQGGFVPMLRAAGYDAEGVDPRAPRRAALPAGRVRAGRAPAEARRLRRVDVTPPRARSGDRDRPHDERALERRRRRRGRVGLGDVRHGDCRMVLRAPRRGRRTGAAAAPTRGMARIRTGMADLPAGVGGRPRAASRRDGCAPARRTARAAASRPRAVLLPEPRRHHRSRRAGGYRRGPDPTDANPLCGRRSLLPDFPKPAGHLWSAACAGLP